MQDDTGENSISKTWIEKYADATWLRTVITVASGALGIPCPVIPVAVGTLDIAITAKTQKIAERRLNLLCASWQQETQHIQRRLIDFEYLESEEFFDLVLRAWEATKRTRSDDKIRLYARILSGSVVLQNRNENSPEDYLSVLEELSPKEIEVARALYWQQREKPQQNEFVLQWLVRIGAIYSEEEGKRAEENGEMLEHGKGQWKKLISNESSLKENDIQFVLLRLEKSGLIYQVSGSMWGYRGGVYVITETFRKLMTYLQNYPASESQGN